jgi:PleD family two-component response regulator
MGMMLACRGYVILSDAHWCVEPLCRMQWGIKIMSSLQPLRILVMDDDIAHARLAQRALERAGYAVDIAQDGDQGLAMFQAGTHRAWA